MGASSDPTVQILAEHLTMDPADISVSYADSDAGLNGTAQGAVGTQ